MLAAYRANDVVTLVDELERFCFIHSVAFPISADFGQLVFFPEGISHQVDGVTHYTRLYADKPKAKRFEGLQKVS